jgi:hypothetical protein
MRDEKGRMILLTYVRLQSSVSTEHYLLCTDVDSNLNSMCRRLQSQATICESDELVTFPLRQGDSLLPVQCTATGQELDGSSKSVEDGDVSGGETVANNTASAIIASDATMATWLSSFVLIIFTAAVRQMNKCLYRRNLRFISS